MFETWNKVFICWVVVESFVLIDCYQRRNTLPVHDFKWDALEAHNKLRQKHHVQPLKLNRDLCKLAKERAKYLVTISHLQRSHAKYKGHSLGENVAYQFSMKGGDYTGKEITQKWYSQESKYDYGKFTPGTGAFTQIVWKATTEMGIGKAADGKGGVYVVAYYYPSGNMIGQYAANVLRPSNQPHANKIRSKYPRIPDSPRNPRSQRMFGHFQTDALQEHNKLRQKHHVQPLKLNRDLCKLAQDRAEHLVTISHSQRGHDKYKGQSLGENIAYQFSMKGGDYTGKEITQKWYSQESKYDYSAGRFIPGTRAFTQIVWKATTEMGIGKAADGRGGVYVVAYYYPSGNMIGHYAANVLRPTA